MRVMDLFAPRYRLVPARHGGFFIQIRRFWWPFWTNLAMSSFSLEESHRVARHHADRPIRAREERKRRRDGIAYLGSMRDK